MKMRNYLLFFFCFMVTVTAESKNRFFCIPSDSINKIEVFFYNFDIYTAVPINCETFEELSMVRSKKLVQKKEISDFMHCFEYLETEENNIQYKINVQYPNGRIKKLYKIDGTIIKWDDNKYEITPRLIAYLKSKSSFSNGSRNLFLKNETEVRQFTRIMSELYPIADIIDTRAKAYIYTNHSVILLCFGEYNMKVIGEKRTYKLTEEVKKYIAALF